MTLSAVALASLQQALASSEIDSLSCTALNISGGGVEPLKREHATKPVEPWFRVSKETGVTSIIEALALECVCD